MIAFSMYACMYMYMCVYVRNLSLLGNFCYTVCTKPKLKVQKTFIYCPGCHVNVHIKLLPEDCFNNMKLLRLPFFNEG